MWHVTAYLDGKQVSQERTGNLDRTRKAAEMLKTKLTIRHPKQRVAVCYSYIDGTEVTGVTYV